MQKQIKWESSFSAYIVLQNVLGSKMWFPNKLKHTRHSTMQLSVLQGPFGCHERNIKSLKLLSGQPYQVVYIYLMFSIEKVV